MHEVQLSFDLLHDQFVVGVDYRESISLRTNAIHVHFGSWVSFTVNEIAL